MIVAYKLILFIILLLMYIPLASAGLLIGKQIPALRNLDILVLSEFSKFYLARLGINVRVELPENIDMSKPYFITCNHMSYLDILIITSVIPARFVTSVEMKNTFFLGFLTMLGGSLYTERRNPKELKSENSSISKMFAGGQKIVVFPEGTSTDGCSGVQKFKSSLFQAAAASETDVLPLSLKVIRINNEPFSKENCDYFCWYADMTFVPHFLKMLKADSMDIVLEVMPPISSKGKSRKELANICQEKISRSYETKTAEEKDMIEAIFTFGFCPPHKPDA